MALVTDFAVKDNYKYLNGFGSYHEWVSSLRGGEMRVPGWGFHGLGLINRSQDGSVSRGQLPGQQHAAEAAVRAADGADQRGFLHVAATPQLPDMDVPGDVLA